MALDLLDIVLLLVGVGIFWWLIGGWASLRAPRVFGPLLVAVACVGVAAWASRGIDAIRAGEGGSLSAGGFGTLAFAAMLAGAVAFGWSLFAGYRLRQAREGRASGG